MGNIVISTNSFIRKYRKEIRNLCLIQRKLTVLAEFSSPQPLKEYGICELYELYNKTGDIRYSNEIFNRCYNSLREENEPARQKIYHCSKKVKPIDKSD